jgi:hypothetical protein
MEGGGVRRIFLVKLTRGLIFQIYWWCCRFIACVSTCVAQITTNFTRCFDKVHAGVMVFITVCF